MKLKIKVLSILLIGITLSITAPQMLSPLTTQKLKEKIETTTQSLPTISNKVTLEEKKDTAVPVAPKEEIVEEVKEEPAPVEVPKEEPKQEEPKVEIVQADPSIPYENMTLDQLIEAIGNGSFRLESTAPYNTNANKLTKSKGALYYNNHKETYYSQRVLPGTSLNIPGRHVADDGTVRDGEGYICVAANSSYLSKGSVVKTSLGPAKVYDSGCASGVIDIYTNW